MRDKMYARAGNIKEALEFLDEYSTQTLVVSGGTDSLIGLYESKKKYLLDISHIKTLSGIKETKTQITIGPQTKIIELEESKIIEKKAHILWLAAREFGAPQIRNMGTIGGNIVNASPAGDTIPPLYLLDASLKISSSKGERTVPIHEFFRGPKKSKLKSDELITKIIIPLKKTKGRELSCYYKLGQRKALTIAKVILAMRAFAQKDGTVHDVKIALGSVAPTVIFAHETMNLLEQKFLTATLIQKAPALIRTECSPIDDIRSTAEYRKLMVGRLLKRGLMMWREQMMEK